MRDRHRACCPEKNPGSVASFVYLSVLWIAFGKHARLWSQNGIYFCSARHISSHMGICHLILALLDGSSDTLSANINLIVLS